MIGWLRRMLSRAAERRTPVDPPIHVSVSPPGPASPGQGTGAVAAVSAPAAGAVCEAPGAGAAGTQGRTRAEPARVDRTVITPLEVPRRPRPPKGEE